MSKYLMRQIEYKDGNEIEIPAGSLNIQIVWSHQFDCWILQFLELVQV